MLEPLDERDQGPGFDLWTGLPHGRTYVCDETSIRGDGSKVAGPPPYLVIAPIPTELVGRRTIPLPIGFAVGVFIAAPLVFGLDAIRRRRDPEARVEPSGD